MFYYDICATLAQVKDDIDLQGVGYLNLYTDIYHDSEKDCYYIMTSKSGGDYTSQDYQTIDSAYEDYKNKKVVWQ